MAERDLSDNAKQAMRCEQLEQHHATSLAAACWAEMAQHAASRTKGASAAHGEQAAQPAQAHGLKSDLLNLGHDAGRLAQDPKVRHGAEGALTVINPVVGLGALAADRKAGASHGTATAGGDNAPATKPPAESATTPGQKASELGHDAMNLGRDLKNSEQAKQLTQGAKKLFGHFHKSKDAEDQ